MLALRKERVSQGHSGGASRGRVPGIIVDAASRRTRAVGAKSAVCDCKSGVTAAGPVIVNRASVLSKVLLECTVGQRGRCAAVVGGVKNSSTRAGKSIVAKYCAIHKLQTGGATGPVVVDCPPVPRGQICPENALGNREVCLIIASPSRLNSGRGTVDQCQTGYVYGSRTFRDIEETGSPVAINRQKLSPRTDDRERRSDGQT